MISRKVRFAYLLVIGVVLIFAVEACADPVGIITHISADTVYTAFDPNLGTNLGVLEFSQYTPIEVDYDDGTSFVYGDEAGEYGVFSLWTELLLDRSLPNGIAWGEFGGENSGFEISYFDGSDEHILLSGEVVELSLIEVFDGMGCMSGIGNLKITGGNFFLRNQFGTEGELFDVTFRIDPRQIDDFTVPFSGESDVTIVPAMIPEPCSILLFVPAVLGVGGMLIRRRRK